MTAARLTPYEPESRFDVVDEVGRMRDLVPFAPVVAALRVDADAGTVTLFVRSDGPDGPDPAAGRYALLPVPHDVDAEELGAWTWARLDDLAELARRAPGGDPCHELRERLRAGVALLGTIYTQTLGGHFGSEGAALESLTAEEIADLRAGRVDEVESRLRDEVAQDGARLLPCTEQLRALADRLAD